MPQDEAICVSSAISKRKESRAEEMWLGGGVGAAGGVGDVGVGDVGGGDGGVDGAGGEAAGAEASAPVGEAAGDGVKEMGATRDTVGRD